MKPINVLTIAGTDPSGGAGIQADLKTFSALGTYGCSVITMLLAQNTRGVQSFYRVKPDFVSTQLESIFSDVRIDSIKIGMLFDIDIIEVVSDYLKYYKINSIVLDTVMFAKSGDSLLLPGAKAVLQKKLFPQVSIITPNLPEAADLLETRLASSEKDMKEQGLALLESGCNAVLIKGGHLENTESPDWLFTKNSTQRFTTLRVKTKNTHGAGCTFSAALAALKPRYYNWNETVLHAKTWLSSAIKKSNTLDVGKGNGPIHHFYKWW